MPVFEWLFRVFAVNVLHGRRHHSSRHAPAEEQLDYSTRFWTEATRLGGGRLLLTSAALRRADARCELIALSRNIVRESELAAGCRGHEVLMRRNIRSSLGTCRIYENELQTCKIELSRSCVQHMRSS